MHSDMAETIASPASITDGWDQLLVSLPGAHVLQSWEWGTIKSLYGWESLYYTWIEREGEAVLKQGLPETGESVVGAALVLSRTLSATGITLPLRIIYVPKGPVIADWANLQLRKRILDDLVRIARQNGAILIKIDPDVRLGTGVPGSDGANDDTTGLAVKNELQESGWVFSAEQVQFRNTVVVDLKPTEEEILARMKQKTRYNVRLAARKGVVVHQGMVDDLEMLYQMYAETSVRDGFVIREKQYYLDVWRTFIAAGIAEPIIAEVEGSPVAAIIIFRFAEQAWYLYGMSRQEHREKMPNHMLQWEAMRRAKADGCTSYDLWGAPDIFDESDPLWGVYRFKEGFGGKVIRHIGAWDMPLKPGLYRVYAKILPMVIARMRQRGLARLQQEQG